MAEVIHLPVRKECTSCELHEVARSVGTPTIHLPASLPPNPSSPCLIFVGQNPGFEEDQSGQPFVGPSGNTVRNGYAKVGDPPLLSRASIYLTNAVRCHTLKNEPPKEKHIKACLPHLAADISTILDFHSSAPHRAVIALGAKACAAVYTHFTDTKRTLADGFSKQPFMHNDIALFTTYHPAAILRQRNLLPSVIDHMSLVLSYLEDTLPIPSAPTIIPPCSPLMYERQRT